MSILFRTCVISAWAQPLKFALYDIGFISYIAQNYEKSAIERSCKGQEAKRRPRKGQASLDASHERVDQLGEKAGESLSFPTTPRWLWESRMCSYSSSRRKKTKLRAMSVFDQLWHF